MMIEPEFLQSSEVGMGAIESSWRVETLHLARIPLAGQTFTMRYLFIIFYHLPIPDIPGAHHLTEVFDYTCVRLAPTAY
jgi:hypothetical protein